MHSAILPASESPPLALRRSMTFPHRNPRALSDRRARIVRVGAAASGTIARSMAGVSDSMGRRLYVGNLPYSATEDQLTELFGRAGKVDNVRVMRDMATGRARGFAFVEMGTDEDAQKAITEFHEQQMDGRALVVNEARPKPEGGFGGGGGGAVAAVAVAAVAAAAAAATTAISPAAAQGTALVAHARTGQKPVSNVKGPAHCCAGPFSTSPADVSRSACGMRVGIASIRRRPSRRAAG